MDSLYLENKTSRLCFKRFSISFSANKANRWASLNSHLREALPHVPKSRDNKGGADMLSGCRAIGAAPPLSLFFIIKLDSCLRRNDINSKFIFFWANFQ